MSSSYPTSTTNSNKSRRKWFVDLRLQKHERLAATVEATSAVATTTVASANDQLQTLPVGFSKQHVADIVTPDDGDRLIARRSWDIALQPIKQLPMNMILAWMAGNSFSLMSIMIVVMLFMKPIQVKSECLLSIYLVLVFLFSRSFLLVQHLHH